MHPRKSLDHEAPYWVTSEADYFLTLCAEPRKQNHFCHPDLGKAVLNAAKLYHEQHAWWCHLILLMPDHIHMLVCFPPEKIHVSGCWLVETCLGEKTRRHLAKKLF